MSSDSHVPRPDNLNYQAVPMHNGRYRMRKIPINNLQLPLTVDPASTTMVEFKLPAGQVWNTSRSTIDYSIDIAAPSVATQSNFTFEDTFEICSSIQFCNASGVYLTDLQNANMYVHTARKIDISQEDFEGNDCTSGLYKSFAPSVQANFFPPTFNLGVDTNVYNLAIGALSAAVTPIEPQYARGDAANSATTVTRSMPLSCFTQTALGIDRDYVFPEEMYVRIQIAPVPKLGYCATTATNPAFAALLNAVSIKAMSLQLALQVDPDVVAMVLDRYQSGKMAYVIPYVYGWKQGVAANVSPSTSSFQVSLNNQYGNRLKRMLYTCSKGTETGVSAYDRQNMNGAKIESYQTFLDTAPLQDSVLSCKQPISGVIGMDDWRENRMIARGSAIENSAAYYLNWFHCDSFSNPKRDKVLTPFENIIEGLSLKEPRQWTVTANHPIIPAGGLNHYVFGTFIRQVQTSPAGTFVTVA